MVTLSISTPEEIKTLGPWAAAHSVGACMPHSRDTHCCTAASAGLQPTFWARLRDPAQILGHVLGLTVLTLSTLPLPDTPAGPGFCPSMTPGLDCSASKLLQPEHSYHPIQAVSLPVTRSGQCPLPLGLLDHTRLSHGNHAEGVPQSVHWVRIVS